MVKVLVGLGNPGHTYYESRHNIGNRLVEELAEQHGLRLTQRVVSPHDGRPSCVYGEYRDGHATVRLMIPLTMMNASGEALRGLQVPHHDLLLVCDDVNLPLGALRLRPKGGPGGHHGMLSCLEMLGSEDVPRLRIGVGVDPLPEDLRDFVLSPFRGAERPIIKTVLEQAILACDLWVREGIDMAMNQCNRTTRDLAR